MNCEKKNHWIFPFKKLFLSFYLWILSEKNKKKISEQISKKRKKRHRDEKTFFWYLKIWLLIFFGWEKYRQNLSTIAVTQGKKSENVTWNCPCSSVQYFLWWYTLNVAHCAVLEKNNGLIVAIKISISYNFLRKVEHGNCRPKIITPCYTSALKYLLTIECSDCNFFFSWLYYYPAFCALSLLVIFMSLDWSVTVNVYLSFNLIPSYCMCTLCTINCKTKKQN